MKKEYYEIPTKNELLNLIEKFTVPNQKNYFLHILKNMCNHGHATLLIKKGEKDFDLTILILDNTIQAMEDHIRSKEKLKIDFTNFEVVDHFTYGLTHCFKHKVIEYENDTKLYNDNNFDVWFDNIIKTNLPKVKVLTTNKRQSDIVESIYCYIFGYEKLFTIPGDYQCKSITIPYDDIIDLSYLSAEAFGNLVDLVKEKTIREVIKVKEGLTLQPLNIPNMDNINFTPKDRNYTKKDLKYLNQRKIKELCYYLKLGYDANEIHKTGLYGKNLIYNNTRKLLTMGIFTRDEINIKFPEHNNEFTETYHRNLMYRKWLNMIDRCYNEENISYHNYGGRGISVCNEWKDPDKGFENYYTDIIENIGYCPGNGYSIDRIKNNGNYTLGNIRWATDEEQNKNRSFKRNQK